MPQSGGVEVHGGKVWIRSIRSESQPCTVHVGWSEIRRRFGEDIASERVGKGVIDLKSVEGMCFG